VRGVHAEPVAARLAFRVDALDCPARQILHPDPPVGPSGGWLGPENPRGTRPRRSREVGAYSLQRP
jgi:hypothetical protein